MTLIIFILTIGLGYLIGSFPTGYVLVKLKTGKDLRTLGSGSTGATNVRRELGDGPARMVLAIDFLKGVLPTAAVVWWLYPKEPTVHVLMAIALVLGHSKSIFLGFKGGKSAATGLGTVVAMSPLAGVAVGLSAFLVTHFSRIVSLGSMTAAVVTPLALFFLGAPLPHVLYGLVTGLYVIFLHRENIGRLLNGTESRLE